MLLDSNFFLESLNVGETNLSPEESLHIAKAFRAKNGDSLTLCDGKGRFAEARVLNANPQSCLVKITSVSEQAAPPLLHLAIACQQNSEEEEIIFHAAQLPIAAMWLIRTERSLEPKNSNLDKLCRRLKAKSLAALKQSRKPYITEIKPPIYLNDFLKSWSGKLIVCDMNGNANAPKIQTETAILCGPEGGFTPKEIETLAQQNAYMLSLGSTRLRAVTAPLLALGKII